MTKKVQRQKRRNPFLRRRLAQLPLRQDRHRRRHRRLERIRRGLWRARRDRGDRAAVGARGRQERLPARAHLCRAVLPRRGLPPAAWWRWRSARSRTRCSTSRPRRSACPATNCSAARSATASASTGRIARPGASIIPTGTSRRSPSLDGVKAIGREVREKGFTALKTNIFVYDRRQARRAGGPASARRSSPRSMSTATVLRNLLHAPRSDPRRRRARCRPAARPQLQRQDRRLSEDPARHRRHGHVLGRDRHLQSARRSAISAARARIRSHPARRCWACANSCPISANRRWTSPSSTRPGTACGNR